jgi:hypothetical protein
MLSKECKQIDCEVACTRRCKCNFQVKGEDTTLYGKGESQGSVTRARSQTARISSSARPKAEAHTAARNVSHVLESCQRIAADERGVQACTGESRDAAWSAAWSAAIRMDGFVGVFAWKAQPVWLSLGSLRCGTKHGGLECLLALDSCHAMPCKHQFASCQPTEAIHVGLYAYLSR